MQKLFETLRKSALPGIWSQGVKLAREQAVTLERSDENEFTLCVRTTHRPIPATVVLYPEDAEWACDCNSRVDPCEHVAAAVIALAQARQKGEALAPARQTAAVVSYRFSKKNGQLGFERQLVTQDRPSELIHGSLSSLIARRAAPIHPTHEDLAVDRIVAHWQPGFLAPDRTLELFRILAGAPDVRLDGEPVKTSAELVLPRAVVEDDPQGGVRLRIVADPSISELVYFGVVRCGDTLHLLGETTLTGMSLERLPLTRSFAREQLGLLVGKVLPELGQRMAVVIETDRLPSSSRGDPPRIVMDLDQREHTLSVLPLLVYGDPPRARIDHGELVHLSGAVPKRDEAAEKQLLARLRAELNLVPGRRVHFDGNDALRFAERLRAWQGCSDSEAYGIRARPLEPKLTLRGDTFELTFQGTSEDGGGTASAEAVLRSYRDGLGLVPLEGGGWASIPHDWLARCGTLVADLLAARRPDGTLPTAVLPVLAALCDELEEPPPPGLARLRPLLQDFAGIPSATLPRGLRATLRGYQRRGVDWLSFLREARLGAILADDMGLGKTLQTLCALRGRTLVVCPKSVVHNWADEVRRFLPELSVSIYHGPKRKLDPAADLTLTTYAILRTDTELLAAETWDALVLDEAQAIKNPDSQAARAAYAVPAEFRLALSGTPVENRLEELWSLCHFTNPGLLGGRSDFRDRYEGPIGGGDASALGRLRARLKPFVLRRLKREVAPELPPRTDVTLYCELDDPERAVYDAVRAAAQPQILEQLAAGGNLLAVLELLLRLRQAACHPALVPGQQAESSSKVERLLEALEDVVADGHKALVFSQWTSLLDLIEPHLVARDLAFVRLDGSTRDRASVVGAFQSSEGPPLMLVSLKAGGTGLNLTQADHVFLLDPWWNPKVEDQAADRAHRIGQNRPVMVYRLVAKDTVEEGILALQERKRAIADQALEETDQARALTREDLLTLLR